jgi:hypothetical protein
MKCNVTIEINRGVHKEEKMKEVGEMETLRQVRKLQHSVRFHTLERKNKVPIPVSRNLQALEGRHNVTSERRTKDFFP